MAKYYDFTFEEHPTASLRIYTQLPKSLKVDEKEFERIWKMHPQELGKVIMYGKLTTTPRYQHPYGRDYKFSGVDHQADPITDEQMLREQKFIEKESGYSFNGCLRNWYRDGSDYIGKHSDDESGLIVGRDIWSFNYCVGKRDMIFRDKTSNKKYSLPLTNNMAVVMKGDCQKYYTHEIPKRLREKNRRINSTWRCFQEDDDE